jgi:hypothetical protein
MARWAPFDTDKAEVRRSRRPATQRRGGDGDEEEEEKEKEKDAGAEAEAAQTRARQCQPKAPSVCGVGLAEGRGTHGSLLSHRYSV